MSEPFHPPYESGAMTSPRQLVRWLDVNAQNGALTRTQTFIAIPAFSVAHVWNGYSEIVGEYHYSAPNNFSFKVPYNGDLLPIGDTNYTLCVSYISPSDSRKVLRYVLIRSAEDKFYFDAPVYAGQPIQKNFKIEIWNTPTSPSVELYDTIIYTSVLGSLDYRYGTDSPLVLTRQLCSNEGSIGTVDTTPPVFNSLQLWLDPLSNANALSWTDRQNGIVFIGNNNSFDFLAPNQGSLGQSQLFTSAGILSGPKDFYYHFYYISTLTDTEILFSVIDIHTFRVYMTDGTPGEDPKSIAVLVNDAAYLQIDGLVANMEYIIHVNTSATNGTLVEIYQAKDLILVATGSIPQGIDFNAGDVVNIGNEFNGINTNITTRSILAYSDILTDDLKQSVLQYISSTLSDSVVMVFPWVWDVCSVPPIPPIPPPPASSGGIGVSADVGIGIDNNNTIGIG